MNQVLRSNNYGQLTYNQAQNEFTIEFGNVNFKLKESSFELFEKQLFNLSDDYTMYRENQKINIPVADTGITLVLSIEELISLKNLLGMKTEQFTSFKLTINYSMNQILIATQVIFMGLFNVSARGRATGPFLLNHLITNKTFATQRLCESKKWSMGHEPFGRQ